MSTAESPRHHSAREHIRETVVLVVLSVTAVLTAWCGFESAKWGGAMSTSFSAASSSRIQAARYDSAANSARQADLSIWTVYVQATAQDDTALKSYVEKRFTPAFAVAYRAWRAAGEPTNGSFAMPGVRPSGKQGGHRRGRSGRSVVRHGPGRQPARRQLHGADRSCSRSFSSSPRSPRGWVGRVLSG